MRTTIDKAGRIVVPKALRDALGLRSGTPLEITVVDGRLEVEPPAPEVRVLSDEDGRPYICAPAAASATVDDVRALRLSGLDRACG